MRRRVALVPESCKKLIQAGYEIVDRSRRGRGRGVRRAAYRRPGGDRRDPAALVGGDLRHRPSRRRTAGRDETGWMRPGAIYVGSLMPLRHLDAVRALAARKVTAFATDAIPRTTRAQSMDTLSSHGEHRRLQGRAARARSSLDRYFPMLMTAAGMVRPAKVFVIGAGVAGLQAIATARRLGANVVATDVRPEVKEQIESVGAKYVGIELKESAAAGGGYAKELSDEDRARQARDARRPECAQSDVVITTALIGGVFAPRLISADIVRRMKPGSIIVDLAADGGGNCELSKPGEAIVVGGVTDPRAAQRAGARCRCTRACCSRGT